MAVKISSSTTGLLLCSFVASPLYPNRLASFSATNIRAPAMHPLDTCGVMIRLSCVRAYWCRRCSPRFGAQIVIAGHKDSGHGASEILGSTDPRAERRDSQDGIIRVEQGMLIRVAHGFPRSHHHLPHPVLTGRFGGQILHFLQILVNVVQLVEVEAVEHELLGAIPANALSHAVARVRVFRVAGLQVVACLLGDPSAARRTSASRVR